jgi:hypothetical protein
MEQHVLSISIDYRDQQSKVNEIYSGTEDSLQKNTFYLMNMNVVLNTSERLKH